MRRAARTDATLGQRFNRWTVLAIFPGSKYVKRTALVRCDCGTEGVRGLQKIAKGESVSCGCFRAVANVVFSKHGGRATREYLTWCGMKQRCTYPGNRNYRWYGAKGIRVCEEWSASFAAFLRDMGQKPTPQYTLDRINPFGHYEPDNCRWATWAEQRKNRRIHHA